MEDTVVKTEEEPLKEVKEEPLDEDAYSNQGQDCLDTVKEEPQEEEEDPIPKYTIVGTLKRKKSAEDYNFKDEQSNNTEDYGHHGQGTSLNLGAIFEVEPGEESDSEYSNGSMFRNEPHPEYQGASSPGTVLQEESMSNPKRAKRSTESPMNSHDPHYKLPKYTIVDHRSKVGSPILKEVKDEPLDYDGLVKDEQLDWTNSSQMSENSLKIVKDEEWDPTMVEDGNLLKEVKDEQLDNEGGSPLKEVKEEPLDQEEKPTMSDIQMSTISYSTHQEEEPKMEPQEGPSSSDPTSSTPSGFQLKTPYCCLCGVMEDAEKPLANVPLKSELLILATGFALAGKITTDTGKELMSRKQTTYSCPEHYREADVQIRKSLNIEEGRQFYKVAMVPLMGTVIVICPQMTTERFKKIYDEFHWKHHPKKKTSNSQSTTNTARCELCNRRQLPQNLSDVNHKGTKYLMAVSSVLQGYRNKVQAIYFSHGNATRRICQAHMKSTLIVILKQLKIGSVNETPRDEDLDNLMTIVCSVWVDCTKSVFWDTFRWFGTKQAVRSLSTAPTHPPRVAPYAYKPEPPPIPIPMAMCSLCSNRTNTTRGVKDKNTKLVLAIGACLSRQMDVPLAKKFMSGNAIKQICEGHFSGAFKEILQALQIRNLTETPTHARAQNVTQLVHAITSTKAIGYGDFVGIANKFVMNTASFQHQ